MLSFQGGLKDDYSLLELQMTSKTLSMEAVKLLRNVTTILP
jgi:hypothetical protein